jgi:hypothetical protein
MGQREFRTGTDRDIDIPVKATYHAGAIIIHTIRKQKEDE